jgi:hypothetical protein
MSRNVNNPPVLVPQQTVAWCFAAAEVMARAYRNLPVRTQYQIARDFIMARVNAQDPVIFNQWNEAGEIDLLANEVENDGANLNSRCVQLIRSTYGAVNEGNLGGTLVNNYTVDNFRADIDANRIVIIGNHIHYYVVYGYNDTVGKDFTLLVRDSWPANVGGQLQTITHAVFSGWAHKAVIHF